MGFVLFSIPHHIPELVPPKIAPFSFGNEAHNYGEPASVICSIVGGDLPMDVFWTLNGAPLDPYLEVLTEKRGKRIHNLIIETISAKHAGNFTCHAENMAGKVSHTAELIVNGLCELLIAFRLRDPFCLNFSSST